MEVWSSPGSPSAPRREYTLRSDQAVMLSLISVLRARRPDHEASSRTVVTVVLNNS